MVTIYYYTLLVKIICANFKSSLSVAKNGKIKYDFELINKGSHPLPNRMFFYTLCKGGRGGQAHVQKFMLQICVILEATF